MRYFGGYEVWDMSYGFNLYLISYNPYLISHISYLISHIPCYLVSPTCEYPSLARIGARSIYTCLSVGAQVLSPSTYRLYIQNAAAIKTVS
jgi:hypothetical protein